MKEQKSFDFFNYDDSEILFKKNFYDITTEFIEGEKSLVLKDYMEIFDPEAKIQTQKISYQFTDNNKNLQITA